MEELAKALAEAIRTGSTMAPSALLGYYAVRIAETFSFPLGFVGVATIAGYTVRRCVLRYAEVEMVKVQAQLTKSLK